MRRQRVGIGLAKQLDAAAATNKATVLAFLQAVHDGRRRATLAQLEPLLQALLPGSSDISDEPRRRGRWGSSYWCADPARWRATFDELYDEIEAFVDPGTADRFEAARQLALSAWIRRAAGSHPNSDGSRAGAEVAVLTIEASALADLASGGSAPSLSEAVAAARQLDATRRDTGEGTAMALMHEHWAVLAAATELSALARSVVGGRVEAWLMQRGWGPEDSLPWIALSAFEIDLRLRSFMARGPSIPNPYLSDQVRGYLGLPPSPDVRPTRAEKIAWLEQVRAAEEARWWVGSASYGYESVAKRFSDREGLEIVKGNQFGPGDPIGETMRLVMSEPADPQDGHDT
jgi:hypothetical protein